MLYRITIIFILAAASAGGAPEKASPSPEDLLNKFSSEVDPAKPNHRLTPEWIGTERSAFTKGVENPAPPTDIRFTHAGIYEAPPLDPNEDPHAKFHIMRLRGSSYVSSEGPTYRATLPPLEELSKFTTGNQFTELFGPQHGWTDAWGGPGGRMHWTLDWTWFTQTKPDQLRYLSLFARVSSRKGDEEIHLESLEIREGFFRPADPGSAEEKAKYLSGDLLAARQELDKKAAREKYPRPLRDLLAAREAPNDHDLAAYTAYLAKARESPDPVLIRQLLAHMHEDTVRYRGMLEALFLDGQLARLSGLPPWNENKKTKALGLLIDHLPATKDDWAFRAALEVALKSVGGGKLDLRDPRGRQRIDFAITLTRNGHTANYGTIDRSPALLTMAQAALRKLVTERPK